MTIGSMTRSFALLALTACSMNVVQDVKSGPDAKAKGAKKIRVGDDGEGTAKGIVTYPGGDRVDWKVFEIPKAGDVEVSLRWTPPREGEDLSMNILDDTFHVIRRLAPAPESGKTKKTTSFTNLGAGKYYLQVYASGRGDAGEYEVRVHWSETRLTGNTLMNAQPLANPPNLAAVPGIVAEGGDKPKGPVGSKTNPCQVGQQCPPGALFVNPACPAADPMPLGAPCPPQPAINPACPYAGPILPGEPCPPLKKLGKITQRQIQGAEVEVIINLGSKQGIQKGFTGVVFKGKSGTALLPNAEFVIYKVTDSESYAKLKKVPLDALTDNTRVELTSPPAK